MASLSPLLVAVLCLLLAITGRLHAESCIGVYWVKMATREAYEKLVPPATTTTT
uniref:Uncharacterized protein n=1 Tax=Musa acuminata subsp. malaccensis TaxID=214687 RepID=A0A804KDL7_MUSAM